MLTRRSLIGASVAALVLAGRAPGAAALQPVLIGGGPADGADTAAAQEICRAVNERAAGTYDCFARPTPGSVFNIRAVAGGLMEFGFARSDGSREAVDGRGAWEGRPATSLRSAVDLQTEGALLVTGTHVADDLVYEVVRTVFETLDALGRVHPAFLDLDPAAAPGDLAPPLHPGAARYYRERGWLPAQ